MIHGHELLGGGMWEGGGGQDGEELGGEWDNGSSIINKYIKKKKQIREKGSRNIKKRRQD